MTDNLVPEGRWMIWVALAVVVAIILVILVSKV